MDVLRSIGVRVLVFTMSLLIASQALSGCAEMNQEQKGTATGAGLGALVGAAAGAIADKKNPGQGVLAGATAGALVGGAAGWVVSAYQVKQVKQRQEVVSAINYTPQQGVVTRIDRVVATPSQLKPGDRLTFQSQYTVLSPAQNSQVTVREVLAVYFNDQLLSEVSARERVLTQGTQEVQNIITLPLDAAEGNYRVTATVEPLAVANARKGQATTSFVVSAAARPTATPAALKPPEVTQPAAPPPVVYVKNQVAYLREGAGVNFKTVTTVPRGTQLAVIGEAGPEQNRWYKVKLADGREAWVASSSVTSTP